MIAFIFQRSTPAVMLRADGRGGYAAEAGRLVRKLLQ